LCIWEVDDAITPTPETPHPLRLKETILTAHRANIFSAKFLPHASHPIIASAAGDRRVMVYDVERLDRTFNHLNELNGQVSRACRAYQLFVTYRHLVLDWSWCQRDTLPH
jgi:hypothetical protein